MITCFEPSVLEVQKDLNTGDLPGSTGEFDEGEVMSDPNRLSGIFNQRIKT